MYLCINITKAHAIPKEWDVLSSDEESREDHGAALTISVQS